MEKSSHVFPFGHPHLVRKVVDMLDDIVAQLTIRRVIDVVGTPGVLAAGPVGCEDDIGVDSDDSEDESEDEDDEEEDDEQDEEEEDDE